MAPVTSSTQMPSVFLSITADFLQVSAQSIRRGNSGDSQGWLICKFDQNWRNECSTVKSTSKTKTVSHRDDENKRNGRGSVRNRGRWNQDSVVGIVIKVRAEQFGVRNALEARDIFILEIV